MPSVRKLARDLDWDHVRVFLAAIRSKSLRKAADELHLSHPTARRHLGAFEEELGFPLFDRRSDGLHPTVEASHLREAAEAVEHAMHALGRVADAAEPGLRGPLRVTLPDMLATDLLMPDLIAFTRKWPDIDLEIDPTYEIADLDRREADVAVRALPVGKLPAEHLTGRLAGTGYKAVYGEGDSWIGWKGAEQDAEWVKETEFPDLPIRGAIDSPLVQRSACAQGMGLTQLPCFFAEPILTRRTEPLPGSDIWVVVHPDLRRSPRVRAFRDAMLASLARLEPRLAGRVCSG